MTHLNNHQYRLDALRMARLLGVAVITALLTVSCTFFGAEDPLEEYDRYADTPKHTGEGYDTPVHEINEYSDMTYQLNNRVNILSDEAQSYIQNVLVHETGYVSCIEFAASTPKELLPQRGEIVLSGPNSKFKDGIAQEVVIGGEMDGVYRVITSAVDFEDLFDDLDMTIDMGKALNMAGVTDKPDDVSNDEEEDEDEDDDQTTRASIEEFTSDPFTKRFALPIDFNTETEEKKLGKKFTAKGSLKIKSNHEDSEQNDNTVNVTLKTKARVVKTDGNIVIPFGVGLIADVDYQANLNFEGSTEFKGTFVDKDDVLPESWAIPIKIQGVPLRLKFCLGLNLEATLNLAVEGNASFRLPLHLEADRTLFDLPVMMSPSIFSAGLIADDAKKWSIDKKKTYFNLTPTFSGSFELTFTLSPGIGIFTHHTSLRLLAAFKFASKIQQPKKNSGKFKYGYNIEKDEAINLGFDAGVGVQFTHPKDFTSVFNSIIDELGETQKSLGYIFAFFFFGDEDVDDYNEYIKGVDDLNDLIASVKLPDADKEDEGNKYSAGPFFFQDYDLTKGITNNINWTWSWMPSIDESKNPFKFLKQFENAGYRKEDMIHIEYKLKEKGMLPYFNGYVPCLMITDENEKFKHIVFDWAHIINKDLKDLKKTLITFDIPFSDLPAESDLLARPGFMRSDTPDDADVYDGITSAYDNFYFDKAEKISTRTPSPSRINWIRWVGTEKVAKPQKGCPQYRSFRVQWTVDDDNSDRSNVTGISYEYYPSDQKQEFISCDGRGTYEAVINCFQTSSDDYRVTIMPFVSRFNGALHGEIRYSDYGFIGDIEDHTVLVFDEDGSYEVMNE